jgi:hypothetical protein
MAQAPAAGLAPCAVVTKAEIQEAVGAAVADGTLNANNKSVCDFKVGDAGVVSVMLTNRSSDENAEKTVAELKKRKIAAEVAPGFGESAYSSSPGYGMSQLGAYKGARQVIVTAMLFGAPEAKNKAVVEKVMRKALARVP